jgi:hypothetical protein
MEFHGVRVTAPSPWAGLDPKGVVPGPHQAAAFRRLDFPFPLIQVSDSDLMDPCGQHMEKNQAAVDYRPLVPFLRKILGGRQSEEPAEDVNHGGTLFYQCPGSVSPGVEKGG